MKKQSLIKGTLILGAAGVLSRFLGLFFRWPLMMLIGDEGMGYYQMSYPLYMFYVAIASGLPVAISKLVAEKNALGDKYGSNEVLKKALLLMLTMGTVFSILLVIFSKDIIQLLKWDKKSYYSLIGIALGPLFISFLCSFRGYFQGHQNMTPTAISELIEQVGRVTFGVGLAYLLLPKGIEYSAGGAALGASIGAIFGSIYLMVKYVHYNRESAKEHKFKEIGCARLKDKASQGVLTRLVAIAIPISLGATVSTIMSLMDSFLVPQRLLSAGFTHAQAAVLYGQLTGKAFVLINIPLTLSIALCASLVPSIAESFILKRKLELIRKVEAAFKFSAVIAFPSFLGLFFMAEPILNLLFPGRSDGALILKYLAISIPFIVAAQMTTAILQGSGIYLLPVINLLLGCITKIIITNLLVPIPSINIYGAIIGTIVGYVLASVLNIILVKKKMNISINYYNTVIKPAYASVLMIIAVIFVFSKLYSYNLSIKVACIISITIGILVYTLFIIVFGVFKYSYIKDKLKSKAK